MDIQKEREAFESYANKYLGFRKNQFSKYTDGSYKNDQLRVYSEIWLASAWQAAKAQAVPEGFVLVPKKSTDWQRVNVRDMEPDIEDYGNMSKMDWENLCGEIYDRMVEVGPE